jgi:cellulose 1,4-beta-cellobiosidase
MVISKYLSGTTPATINIAGFTPGGPAHRWQLTSTNAITQLSDLTVTGGAISDTLPAGSITLYVVPMAGAAPAPPTGLTATPGVAQNSLSWTPSTSATSYNLKRSTVNGGPYTTIVNTTATSYTDTGLTNGTTYYYVATSLSSGGESVNSNQASATPQSCFIPSPPTSLGGSAGPGRYTLHWTQSTGTGLTSNKVYRSTTAGGPYSLVTTISPPGTAATLGGTSGTTYYNVVTAINGCGESAYSNEFSIAPR